MLPSVNLDLIIGTLTAEHGVSRPLFPRSIPASSNDTRSNQKWCHPAVLEVISHDIQLGRYLRMGSVDGHSHSTSLSCGISTANGAHIYAG